MTLNSAQKTASSSSVKTILGKTFAGSTVNACSAEPDSVLELKFNKNEHSSHTSYTQGFFAVLISKICPYFESLHLGKYYCPYF